MSPRWSMGWTGKSRGCRNKGKDAEQRSVMHVGWPGTVGGGIEDSAGARPGLNDRLSSPLSLGDMSMVLYSAGWMAREGL